MIACGRMVDLSVRASDALEEEGVAARVLNMHTIKPLNREAILQAADFCAFCTGGIYVRGPSP